MANKRRSAVDSIPSSRCYIDYDYELYDIKEENLNCCHKYRCWFITLTILLLLLVLIFILIFVVPPITFMLSVNVQRYLIFLTTYSNENDFTNFNKHGIEGVRNLYVPVNKNVSLGVWHILPLEYTYAAVENDSYDYREILRDSKYPILLYFHDSGENRITSRNKYLILRRFFHVVTFDYRSFGDSSQGVLLENYLVKDSVRLYKWLRMQTQGSIYIWGHGLGAAIASKTISQLRMENVVPMGLFLESPFTSLPEELTVNPYLSAFTWLPWFKATFIDSLKENGLLFKTDEYILSVDSPIMIMHAEDNKLVPYTLSEKLVQISNEMRDDVLQGNTTFYLFPKQFQYGHNDLYIAAELLDYINNHISICMSYNKGKG